MAVKLDTPEMQAKVLERQAEQESYKRTWENAKQGGAVGGLNPKQVMELPYAMQRTLGGDGAVVASAQRLIEISGKLRNIGEVARYAQQRKEQHDSVGTQSRMTLAA
jgi:hypothetical protein